MSSPPFKVKAVFEYTSPHEDDLHFPLGQIITVTNVEDDDWYDGTYVDDAGVTKEGIFPKNFVEKYEPTAPPRPTRAPRPKKEVEPEPEPPREPSPPPQQVIEPEPEPEPQPEPEPEPEEVHGIPAAQELPPPAPKPQAVISPARQTEFSPPPVAKPALSSKPFASPPVSEKPSGGSFKDRIAAFNKATPPPAPFKPAGFGSGGSNTFIKKPFVAPPPSKNAYVPVIRDPPPQKIYKREEDPEVAASQAENQEQAERAGLAPRSDENDGEDQPKPTSLKERIALLQKQQMEQASRHADAVQKKEKPKRPVKKRTESHEAVEGEEGAPLERRDTGDTIGKQSMDSVREEPPRKRNSVIQPRQSFGDGNEADISGAGETTEGPGEHSTGNDDSDEKPRDEAPPTLGRAPTAPTQESDLGEEEGAVEEDEEGEEEDYYVDPEIQRKEELRARMAKMSGGMGMHGIFGGGMPMPTPAPPRKKKPVGTGERRSNEYGADDGSSPTTRAPPVPMIPLPGMSRARSPDLVNRQLDHEEETTPILATRPAEEVPDVEDAVPSYDQATPSTGKASLVYRVKPELIFVVSPLDAGAPSAPVARSAPPPVPIDSK